MYLAKLDDEEHDDDDNTMMTDTHSRIVKSEC